MTSLEKALMRTAAFLDSEAIPYMVFGGFAVLHWGEPRLTRDIDVKVILDRDRLARVIPALTREFPSRVADPLRFAVELGVLPVSDSDGTPIDLILGTLPLETDAIARAVEISIAGSVVRLCTAEDLILHKLVSDRPRDLEDVTGIVLRMRDQLDRDYLDPRVRLVTSGLDRPDRLEEFERLLVRAGLPALGGG